MSWADAEPVWTALITELATDPAQVSTNFAAQWKDRANQVTHDRQQFRVDMKIVRVGQLGADDIRRQFVPEDSTDPEDAAYLGKVRLVQCGLRRVVMRIEVTPTKHDADVEVMAPLERIRVGLGRQTSRDALSEVNVAVLKIYDAISATRTLNKRRHAASTMDIELTIAVADTDPNPQDWIETVLVTSHARIGGVELPVPPNVIDQVITIADV